VPGKRCCCIETEKLGRARCIDEAGGAGQDGVHGVAGNERHAGTAELGEGD
jgi:hypothetical protein